MPVGAKPALVLLAVKSGATAEAAAALATALPVGTPVLSLQNGISNAAVANRAGAGLNVLPAMVPYNVAELSPGAFHRGTPGRLAAQDHPSLHAWLSVFERAGVPLDLHADLLPVQWGKLLLNLNNPVNALSGLPLRDELMRRGYRRCFAALIEEAVAALAHAGIAPAQVAAVPPKKLLMILRLPDWLFSEPTRLSTPNKVRIKVLILGSRVIGTSIAYYLARSGHEITVFDRQPGPALETSFGNAGEISPGYSSPWAGHQADARPCDVALGPVDAAQLHESALRGQQGLHGAAGAGDHGHAAFEASIPA